MGSSILQIQDETLDLNIFMLRAVRPFLDTKSMVDLYYSFNYPHLIYGIEG